MSKGKVLVVMSSAHALDLKDGRTYSTGYYLNEFVVPYRKLVEAGARVETIANWHPNVVVDRELITGQQPMSAPVFGDALVAKLDETVQR